MNESSGLMPYRCRRLFWTSDFWRLVPHETAPISVHSPLRSSTTNILLPCTLSFDPDVPRACTCDRANSYPHIVISQSFALGGSQQASNVFHLVCCVHYGGRSALDGTLHYYYQNDQVISWLWDISLKLLLFNNRYRGTSQSTSRPRGSAACNPFFSTTVLEYLCKANPTPTPAFLQSACITCSFGDLSFRGQPMTQSDKAQAFQQPHRSVHDCAEVLTFISSHMVHTLIVLTEQRVQSVDRNGRPPPI